MSEIGHNRSGSQLKNFIERIENLEEQKKQFAEDIRDVYLEVKSAGFDVKIVRAVIKARSEDADKRAEREALVKVYLDALGDLADTPLGKAAISNL